MGELAMFPLGTVLLPHMALPLHVFEPRYRALMDDVLAADRRFGVVLITRGHEVGGGDQRSDVGTEARIVHAERLDDGRWLVVALGTHRLRVERWLPDDPYPRAEVVRMRDHHDDTEVARARDAVLPRLRRVLHLQRELGELSTVPGTDLGTDLTTACWELVVAAPLNPLDTTRLLAIDDCAARLEELGTALEVSEDVLAFRLHGGRA